MNRSGNPAANETIRTVRDMPYPSSWPRNDLEAKAVVVVFVIGLVIIVSIRLLTGPPSGNETGNNAPQWRSTSGMGVTARDEAACVRLSTRWAEFGASGTPQWDDGVDMSALTPLVRDAFASAEAMSGTRQRVATGSATTEELRRATDEAAAKTIAGCGFDPLLFDRI